MLEEIAKYLVKTSLWEICENLSEDCFTELLGSLAGCKKYR